MVFTFTTYHASNTQKSFIKNEMFFLKNIQLDSKKSSMLFFRGTKHWQKNHADLPFKLLKKGAGDVRLGLEMHGVRRRYCQSGRVAARVLRPPSVLCCSLLPPPLCWFFLQPGDWEEWRRGRKMRSPGVELEMIVVATNRGIKTGMCFGKKTGATGSGSRKGLILIKRGSFVSLGSYAQTKFSIFRNFRLELLPFDDTLERISFFLREKNACNPEQRRAQNETACARTRCKKRRVEQIDDL